MRWPWTPRPPSPRLKDAFQRIADAEDRLDWLEGQLKKVRARVAAARSAEVRSEDPPEDLPNPPAPVSTAEYYWPRWNGGR